MSVHVYKESTMVVYHSNIEYLTGWQFHTCVGISVSLLLSASLFG